MSCAVCVRDIGPAMRRPHSRLQHQPHLSLGNPHTSCIARLSAPRRSMFGGLMPWSSRKRRNHAYATHHRDEPALAESQACVMPKTANSLAAGSTAVLALRGKYAQVWMGSQPPSLMLKLPQASSK